MAYTSMHGTAGMLLAAISYWLFGWVGAIVLSPILSFCSHLFLLDLYPDYYPEGGWGTLVGDTFIQTIKNALSYLSLWVVIGIILLAQAYLIHWFYVANPILGVGLLVSWFFSNAPDFSEALYKAFTKKSLWFMHPNGWFPKFLAKYSSTFSQKSKLPYGKAQEFEMAFNCVGLSILIVLGMYILTYGSLF